MLSFDPVVHEHRDRYLALLPTEVRERIRLVHARGSAGAVEADGPVDLLFVDSTHEREDTIAEIEAWRPRLAPRAIVVVHDYDNPCFPGVRGAVEALGLRGEVRGVCFIWQAPRAEVADIGVMKPL